MFCAEWSLVNHQPTEVTVAPLRCHCWHCDECRPIRTARLVAEAKAGNPTLFITITSRNPGHGCAHAAAVRLAHAWREARRRYVKDHGPGSLPFLAVFERTKRGWPHMHIVARAKWVSAVWLSNTMLELLDSPEVDVQAIHEKSKVAAYVTKYISKNPERYEGTKRYWRSLDWLAPPDPEDQAPRQRGAAWVVHQCHWRTAVRAIALGTLWVRWSPTSATILPWRPP